MRFFPARVAVGEMERRKENARTREVGLERVEPSQGISTPASAVSCRCYGSLQCPMSFGPVACERRLAVLMGAPVGTRRES